jgi:hypothetical protein
MHFLFAFKANSLPRWHKMTRSVLSSGENLRTNPKSLNFFVLCSVTAFWRHGIVAPSTGRLLSCSLCLVVKVTSQKWLINAKARTTCNRAHCLKRKSDCVDDFDELMSWWLCWCVDELMCWRVDLFMSWCVDDCVDVELVLWWTWVRSNFAVCDDYCVDVWCVDVLMCWCVDVLMTALMCWCVSWCVSPTPLINTSTDQHNHQHINTSTHQHTHQNINRSHINTSTQCHQHTNTIINTSTPPHQHINTSNHQTTSTHQHNVINTSTHQHNHQHVNTSTYTCGSTDWL